MKYIFFLLLMISSSFSFSTDKVEKSVEIQSMCETYSKLSFDDANKLFNKLQVASAKNALALSELKESGIPDDDPKIQPVAKELAESLIHPYILCKCNKNITETKGCEVQIKAVDILVKK